MIRRARSNWRGAIVVCAKCEKLKRRGFGPDGDEALSRLLRKRAGGKGRKAGFGVVAGRCLSVCPKRAVTVVDAARPRDWLIVAAGTPVDEVAAALGLDPSPVAPARAEIPPARGFAGAAGGAERSAGAGATAYPSA